MSDLANWLRSEADRHMTSIAWRDQAVADHATQLRQWAMLVDAYRGAVETLSGMADATEKWNIGIERIIGKQPDSGIDVERAKAALSRVKRFE